MRALATALISVAMALGALGLAIAAPHRGRAPEPKAAFGGASGALQISNSRAGQSVFGAAAMRPGQTVTGSVRIGNAGDVAGRFSVRPADVIDAPGPYGGVLSARLQLALVDVTRAGQPVTVYAGTAAAFGAVQLGTFEPGAQRDYVVAATLPVDSDNSFQGSALSLGLEWRASGAGGAGTPPGTGTPPPTGTAPGTPAGGSPGSPPVPSPARQCVKRRRLTVRLKAPRGARVRSATVKVNGNVKARVKGAKRRVRVKLRGVRTARVKLVVRVRTSNGRSYTSKHSYSVCKRR